MNSLASARASRRTLSIHSIACVGLCASFSLGAQTSAPTADLLPVLVTSPRFAENPENLPFGVSVITAREIAESGVTTVNEALMKLLGIPGRLDLLGGGDYSLDLRGFGTTSDSNQVVILDGVRITEADTGGTRLAGIPIDSVERIEVLRGSGTVLYGEGATAGAIVITTKAQAGAERANRAQVYGAAGSYGLRDLRADATLVAGEFSVDAAANRRATDNDRDNFRSVVHAGAVTGQWRTDGLRVGARYAQDQLRSGLPGSLTAEQYAANPRQTLTPDDSATLRNTRSGVFAQAEVGAWEWAFDAGWRRKESSSEFIRSGFASAYDIDAKDYSIRTRNRKSIGDAANVFVAGVDRDEWSRTEAGDSGSVAEQASNGIYLKDDLTLPNGTRLSAGWRTSKISKTIDRATDRFSIDPRKQGWEFGVLQPLTAATSVYARTGRSFRLANVDELVFMSPDAPLKPQTSRDTEVGLRWRDGGTRAEVRGYRSALTDEIGFDPNAIEPNSPFGFIGANVNFDPTRREGVEFEFAHAPTRTLTLRANATLSRSRFVEGPYAGKDIPLTSRRSLSLRADWALGAGHRIDAGLVALSSQSPDFENVCRIPGRTTADARYAYQWRAAELTVGVDNLTDRKYYTQAFGCADGVTTSIYPEPGRSFTAAVRVRF